MAEVRCLAIVPAYNEEGSVGVVVGELERAAPDVDVVVVDDGSTDRTAAVAAAAGARVVRLPFNLGIGGAMQAGYRLAHEEGYDLAVQVDGDGQHDPRGVTRLRAALDADRSVDMVAGSRFLDTTEEGFRSSRSRRAGIRHLLLAPGRDRRRAGDRPDVRVPHGPSQRHQPVRARLSSRLP